MKWQLPWKRQLDNQINENIHEYMHADDWNEHKNEYNQYQKAVESQTHSTPFVEPFRPLYDITDANQTEDYRYRPLYTPNAYSSRTSKTERISTSGNSYFPRNRQDRSGYNRVPFKNRRYGRSGFSERYGEEEDQSSIITYQWIGAIVLVGALFLVFHSSTPISQRIQDQTAAIFHSNYDISKITAWVHDRLSHLQGNGTVAVTAQPNGNSGVNASPIPIPNTNGTSDVATQANKPTIQSTSSGVDPASAKSNSAYALPLQNAKITSDYKKDTQQEMILTGQPGESVQAVAAGVVAAVDHTQQQGTYVLIDHGAAGKTLYAHLGAASVQLNAKVTKGQTIGTLDKDGKTADMYFGYIKDGKYENPHSIVPFQ